ncbi:hypothetical protein C8Q76DRAFT_794623 [Earliella scabrosa]|nr:hypothetical protein C8Q76DRAFT_794623 [Earliella scabrosa]
MAKTQPPKAYDGKDDNDTFNVWLKGVLEYFAMLRIQGPEREPLQTNMTSNFSEGTTANWYQQNINLPLYGW